MADRIALAAAAGADITVLPGRFSWSRQDGNFAAGELN